MSADGPDKDPHCHRHGSLISTRPLPLRRAGGRSWSPLRHPVLAWRYGWTHPDEDLLGVIDAAGDSLRAQIASAKAVLSGDAREKAVTIEEELEHELCQDVPGLAILLGLEARINALYPPVIQRRRAWMLRDRFERVAPARAVAEYWASNPPEPGGPEVLAEEVRRCEGLVETAQRALDAARAAAPADPPAIAAAETRLGRATAERDVARANAEVDRCRRALAAANEAARNAANGAQAARDAAQAALDAARGALGAASDAFNAAEELLVERGGALPAIAGTAIDADAQTLLDYIHSSYMMSIGREKAVRDLMRWLIMRFWSANVFAVLGLLLVFFLFRILPGGGLMPLANLVVGLFLIAAVGRIGATMSVLQRLQAAVSANILSGDSFLDLARLRTGKNGINLALFSGAVFALLLYAIFATGAPAMMGFQDGLFPRIKLQSVAAPPVAPDQATPVASGPKSEAAPGTDGNASAGEAGNGLVANGVGPAVRPGAARAAPGNSAASAQGNSAAAPGNSVAAADAAKLAANGNSTAAATGNEVAAGDQDEGDKSGAIKSFFKHLFDTSPTAQCAADQSCDPFTQFAAALGFDSRSDFFKLLLWAFLAGFAERLVPDVLDSITKRTRSSIRVEDEAAEAARRRSAGASAPAPAPAAAPGGGNGHDGTRHAGEVPAPPG